jgi:hypothetical protein
MNKLWSYAVFRWCVYQAPLLLFGILASNSGLLDADFRDYETPIWILIFALPAVWVWRKPIWKAIGFLNKKAEEG